MKLKHLFLFEELPVYSEPFYGNDIFKIRFRQLTDLSNKRAPDNDNRDRINNEPLDNFQMGDRVTGIGVRDGEEHAGEIVYIKKDEAGDGTFVKIEDDGKLVRLKPGTVKLQANGKTGNRKVPLDTTDAGMVDPAAGDTFQPFSYESADPMNQDQLNAFAKRIKDAILEIFPESFVFTKAEGHMTDGSIYLKFALGKDKTEWTNGYIENDPAEQSIWIWTSNTPMKVESKTGTLMVRPPEGSHLAFGRVKFGWRNFSANDEDTIVRKLTEYFKKVKQVISDNLDNLMPDSAELAKKKI